MKKTTVVFGAVVLLGAAYVASTWYVGKEAQSMIADAVEKTNERAVKMLGPDLSSARFNIEIRDYQRGLFSSTAQYVIHFVDSDGAPLEYVLQDRLEHGPFPLAAVRDGKLAPMLAYSQAEMVVTPAIQEWFDPKQGQTPLHVETQVGFGGQGTSHWTFAPLETSRAERRASFSGGYVDVVFSDDFNNSVATGHFDLYSLTDNASGEKIEVRDINLNSTTTMVADKHFDHHGAAQVKSLIFSEGPDASAVEVGDLGVEVTSTQKAGFLDARVQYDTARILVDGADLGQMTAAAAVTQLDIDALGDLQATYAAMGAQRGPDTEAGFLLTADEQLILQDKLRPILAAAPTFSLEPILWKNAGGESQASAVVAVRDPGTIETANAAQLLQELIAHATLDVAIERSMVVELFQQVGAGDGTDATQAGELGGKLFDEYADLLTQLGLTTLTDGTLTLALNASPAKDQITLNGDVINTEQLMMLALGLLLLY